MNDTLTLDAPQTPAADASSPNLPFNPAALEACRRIPALWPLKHFVAVNPYVGWSDHAFADVAHLLQRSGNHRLLLPRASYAQAYQSGRITKELLEKARAGMAPRFGQDFPTLPEVLEWKDQAGKSPNASPEAAAGASSVAQLADQRKDGRCHGLVVEEIAKWCAAYYDQGQSSWRMPWRDLGFYSAWKAAAALDAAPEFQGLAGFRSWVAGLPEEAPDALAHLTQQLVPDLSGDALTQYYHQQLLSIAGWSSHVQYRVRELGMHGKEDQTLAELLTVRLAYDCAVLQLLDHLGLDTLWRQHLRHIAPNSGPDRNLLCGLVWQSALELGFQQSLAGAIQQAAVLKGENAPKNEKKEKAASAVQAVFCIDVRSELYRRSLEGVSLRYETLGFAGFFGMAIELIPLGERHGSSQCPVLLLPKYRIKETLRAASPGTETAHLHRMLLHKRLNHAWNAFKNSAVSCFSFVETGGLFYGWKLLRDSVFPARTTLELPQRQAIRPAITCQPVGPHHGVETGIRPDEQVEVAYGALKNMGLTSGFARLVLLCGHGSTTANNPYGSGLDCGACGGNSGDSNARVAAALLNDPAVRASLIARGITLPDETWFLAGLHNTTTDDITLFDLDDVPASHARDVEILVEDLKKASVRTRQLRAHQLGLDPQEKALDSTVRARSLDWSQVRPEWGLAGNAAFIAAPRERTRLLDLKGRSFLHSYDASLDPDGGTLELIMVAPMVVANWINLQYYASTVDNHHYGSGNKVIHNVVGTFGICQGNGGDLQTGLPLQSLHNGHRWVHEPLRLNVFIEARRAEIYAVLKKNPGVRQLVENGWLHLFAIEDQGKSLWQYHAGGSWTPLAPGDSPSLEILNA